MSANYVCKREENQIIITILEDEMDKRTSRSHAPQTPLPWIKAMRAVEAFDFVIKNEYHAEALKDVGPEAQIVIRDGLKAMNKYDPGRGSLIELRRAQEAVKKQDKEELNKRKKKRKSPINKKYIPRIGTATRAMFIVLGKSRIHNEGGLSKDTIISRSRNHTNVDFNAKYDRYGVYDGFKGISTLINHELVIKKKGNLYHITDKGYDVYLEHCQPQQQQQSNNHNSIQSVPVMQENKCNDYNDYDYNDDQLEKAKKLSLQSLNKENQPPNDEEMEEQKRFEKDLEKALKISAEQTTNSNNNNKSNKHNKNNKNGASVLGKRKGYGSKDEDDDDDEIEILSSSPKKKRKLSNIMNIAIDLDLDKVVIPNLNKNGLYGSNIICNGKEYELKLLIDSAEQNLKSRSLHYFNVLKHATEHGVNCQYKQLSNADYIMIIESKMDDNIYLIDFAVERKRWDDLRESVLIDGRGKQQKERLKLTSITRRYYFVEGNDKMIRDYGERQKCKEFIRETEKKDGYIIKYTESKHQSITKLCDWYYKISYLLNKGNEQLILKNLTLKQFQQSQKIQHISAKKEMLTTLESMGFDTNHSEMALIAVQNNSIQDAIDYMCS